MPTILIASPEAGIRTGLSTAFESAGWAVREAATGIEAAAAADSVDVIVADASFAGNGLKESDKPLVQIPGSDPSPSQLLELAQLTLRLREAERQRDAARSKLDSILSVMGEMYIEIDRDWRITLANRAAADYVGALGRPTSGSAFEIFPELRGTELARRVEEAMRTRRRDQFQTPGLLTDKCFEVELAPIAGGLAARVRDITDAKTADALYRASFELASIAMAQVDIATRRYVRVNRKMTELTGYSEAELLTMTISDLTHPEDQPADDPLIRDVQSGARNEYTLQKRYIRKDGAIIWVKLHVGVIRDVRELPVSTTAVIEDISEAKRLNEQLVRAQHNLRRLAEANIVGFASAGGDRVLEANDEFLRILGRTRAELEQGLIDWKAQTPPEYAEADRRGLEALLTTGFWEPFEKEFTRPDGTRVPVLVGATRITDGPEWFAFVLDLSESKRAEEDREAVRRRIEQLLELAQAFIHDEQVGIVFWSSAAEKLYGFSKDDAIGRNPDELLQTRFPNGKQVIFDALESHGTWDGELFHTRRDGAEIVVASHWSVWRDENGRRAMLEIDNDVTERVRAEERLRAAQTGAGLGVWDWNLNTGAVYWSPEYRKLYGSAAHSAPPSVDAWIGMIDEADREQVVESVRAAVQRGGPLDIEFRITRDGETRWIRAIGDISEWRGNAAARVVGIAQDVTDIKAAHAELERANNALQRSNEELRQFAYGVSHDLQEPLRTIASFAQLLARKDEGRLDPESEGFMQHILHAADRMNFMIRDVLKYSSAVHQPPAADIVDLNGVAAWAMGNLRQGIEETGAEVTVENLPTIRGDFARLSQVMQNLIGNALKYRGPEPPLIRLAAERTGPEWTLCVADNGIGFAEEHAEAIFGVFRRLHGRDIPGSGIGLAICRRIIEQHGGRIWAESAPGGGSRFYFTLPALD